jgi:thiamine biosynthesis lipoprotein ApbE
MVSLADERYFHRDHILGTSLDVWVMGVGDASASVCERVVLDEIERLRRIFSTYDPESELSRLNRTTGPFAASQEMLAILHAYEAMQERSSGAFNGQLGELIGIWKAAETTGVEPDGPTLARIVAEINRPGWSIDDAHQTVTRHNRQPLDLNSIAKGYIIRQAVAAARREVPELQGLLLNLGGDMFA